MSFFIPGLFSSIGHIGEPAKYIDLSRTSQNSRFQDCYEIREVLILQINAYAVVQRILMRHTGSFRHLLPNMF